MKATNQEGTQVVSYFRCSVFAGLTCEVECKHVGKYFEQRALHRDQNIDDEIADNAQTFFL